MKLKVIFACKCLVTIYYTPTWHNEHPVVTHSTKGLGFITNENILILRIFYHKELKSTL